CDHAQPKVDEVGRWVELGREPIIKASEFTPVLDCMAMIGSPFETCLVGVIAARRLLPCSFELSGFDSKEPAMLPIHTILHPTDFSKQAEFAFQLACALARDYEAELFVVHVVTPPVVIYGEGVLSVEPEVYQEELREKLNRLHAEEPGVRVVHRLVEGQPVD